MLTIFVLVALSPWWGGLSRAPFELAGSRWLIPQPHRWPQQKYPVRWKDLQKFCAFAAGLWSTCLEPGYYTSFKGFIMIEQLPDPVHGPGNVVIHVKAAGLCRRL